MPTASATATSTLPWRVSPRLIRPRPIAPRIVAAIPSGSAKMPITPKNRTPKAATASPSATPATELPGSAHGSGPWWASGARSTARGEIRQPDGGPGCGPGGTGGNQSPPAPSGGGSDPGASGRSGVSVCLS